MTFSIIKFKSMALVATVLIMAACKVSKDVTVPDTGLTPSFRSEDTTGESIGKMPWNSIFTEPELKSLISNALNHSNDLQIAVKDIQASELILRQAKMGNIPVIALQAGASTSRPSDNSLNGLTLNQFLNTSHIEDYSVAASLSWEADIWGKIRSQKAAALAAYLQTGEARKAVQTRIVSDVAKGYYNLLMLDAQLVIAKQNVRLNDSTLNIIRLQFQAGQVSSLAVQQAEAQRLQAAGLVPQFEQQIAVQENSISILSGVLPGDIPRKAILSNVPLDESNGTGLPSELLGRRPDVKMAELALTQSNGEVGYAKANMYPSLAITAQGGLDAIKASNWFTIPASLFGAVTGSLLQPLINQRKLRTQYEVAKVRREQTVIRFRQSVLVAYEEVSDDLVKIDKLKDEQSFVDQRVATLRQATHNSQLLFQNGLATYLEVITAQGNVLQSELEQANIKKSRLDARVDLYRALGGGWQ